MVTGAGAARGGVAERGALKAANVGGAVTGAWKAANVGGAAGRPIAAKSFMILLAASTSLKLASAKCSSREVPSRRAVTLLVATLRRQSERLDGRNRNARAPRSGRNMRPADARKSVPSSMVIYVPNS